MDKSAERVALEKRREMFLPESTKIKRDLEKRAKEIGYSKSKLMNVAIKTLFKKSNEEIMTLIISKI